MIRVAHVSKSYGHPVLENVSLTVPSGSLLGLVGPGAAGKSVLLKLIAGLVEADEGNVFLDSEPLRHDPVTLRWWHQQFGMGFQNNALFDFLTVGENVSFPLLELDYEPLELRALAVRRLIKVGLRGFENRPVAGLSGGQKKRVGVARATVTDAPFLLFDEPAAGLDPVTSQKIFDMLRQEQRKRRATCIIVSSDIDRLRRVADRIAMLYHGRVVFDGTRREAETTDEPLVRQFLDGKVEGPLT
jgi:phospholipid/cholesterol/gamma-HCH transport system ATP-binding protein